MHIIHYGFILKVMQYFGFDDIFLGWIQNYFTLIRISILVNGSPKGNFSSSKGVRHKDPLSSIVVCIAKYLLSKSLVSLVDNRWFLLIALLRDTIVLLTFYMLITFSYRAYSSNLQVLLRFFICMDIFQVN